MAKSTLTAHLALFGVALIYGSNYVIAKGIMPDIVGPSGFIFLRVYGASILFLSVIFILRKKMPDKKDLGRLALCGLFGIAINQLMFFNGLSRTTAINSAIIMTTTPIIVLILSAIILKERVTSRKIIGIIFGAVGAIGLVVLSARGNLPGVSVTGDSMILINAISFSLYLVIVKPLMSKYDPITVISWAFFFGAIYILPFSLGQAMEIDWRALEPQQLFSIIYVVVVATFVVYLLNVFALSILSPNIVSSYIYLQPVVTLGFGFLFFSLGLFDAKRPAFSVGTAVCTGLIFVGVYLVGRKAKKENLPSAAR